MIYLLFDASAVVSFYAPPNENQKSAIAYLMAKKVQNEAFFYIPSFCIAEVHSTLAKHHYRYGLTTPEEYQEQKTKFKDHITFRKLFYCYYQNRYHNFISEDIVPVEHKEETEFALTGIKPKPNTDLSLEVQSKLRELGLTDKLHKYYLSGLDILIISMALELKRLHGKHKVAIVSFDKRLLLIAKKIKDSGIEALNIDKGKGVFEHYFDLRLRKGPYKDFCVSCEGKL